MILAKMVITGADEIALMLSKLEAGSVAIGKKAVREAADIVTDRMRSNIEKLPEDTFRKLDKDEKFNGIPGAQKKDLLDSLGITPIGVTDDGTINVKVGFSGYGSHPTKTYPQGLPNQLLAVGVDSGSSVRKKTPFIRPTVAQTKALAKEKMQEVVTREIEKL